MVAVYYNRKVAHMVAGGVPLIMSPLVFSDPIYPLFGGILGSIGLAATHLMDKRLWWMQTEQNMNDATFAFMLGVSVYALWHYLDDPWLAILPALFMAYGDGVTGIIRNKMFAKRTKSAWGNFGNGNSVYSNWIFDWEKCGPIDSYLGSNVRGNRIICRKIRIWPY